MFCSFNRKKLCYNTGKCVLIILLITIIIQSYLYNSLSFTQLEELDFRIENGNILLWWTPFLNEEGRIIECDNNIRCFLTSDKKFKNDPRIKAVLFYGSMFNGSDLPLNRKTELWGLLHEESPRNTPLLSHEPVLSLFNYTSTFSRYSDIPLTLQYLPSLNNITDQKYFLSFEAKTILQNKLELAPIVYIQSDCVTPNNRDSYVYELMKYIHVDSYGECLNNKKLPESLSNSLETMMSEELLHFVAQYKFAIAFENAVCEDYITEKLWRPIIAGTVPVYFGSPSVKDWLPNNNSAIFPMEFDTPEELAKYLNFLTTNSSAYNNFRRHKINQEIENIFLTENYRKCDWSPSDDSFGVIDEFQCLLCKNSVNLKLQIVSKEHYNCPSPVSMLDNKFNVSNWWHTDYQVTKCEALALRSFLDDNNNNNKSDSFIFNYIYNSEGNCDL